MDKKRINATLLMALITLPLIIAAQIPGTSIDLGEGMKQIIDQVVNFGAPIFEIIIGDYSGSDFFFAKVLVLLLLIVVIHLALTRIPLLEDQKGVSIIISLIVSILAIRYITTNELFYGILLPYGALGIALTTLIPFVIFAYAIHAAGLPGIGRRISWVIFGIIFIILWIYKSNQISDIGNTIYLVTLAAVIIMLIFDKRVHAYFRGADIRRFERISAENEIANLQAELNRLIRDSGPTPSSTQERVIKRLRKRLRRLGAIHD